MDGFDIVGSRPELAVRDLVRSRAFWCGTLGFTAPIERAGSVVLRSPSGGAEVALRSDPSPSPGRVFLQVGGIEALHQRLTEAGAEPGALHTHESARRTFEVRDPDGHLVVFGEPARRSGRIAWVDLTVPDAAPVRDFWQHVVGFDGLEGCDMGGYEDWSLLADGRPVAGVCHARGDNEGLPPVWMVYFTVEDLDEALAEVEARGGAVIRRRTRMAVIRDPSGAVAAIFAVRRSEVR